jgi:tellurite resistance protein TerC
MGGNILLWVAFNIFIVLMLLLDIFVFNKKVHALKITEALVLTGFWVSLAIVFCLGVYWRWGSEFALEFATGYIIEQSLSVDNLFVILMLFTFFRTPTAFQQKVLIWGVLGAIFFRVLFILAGVSLINQFQYATYILGAFLIFSSIKMLFESENNIDPDKNIAIRLFRKIMPVTRFYEGSKFFTYQNKILHATPLFVTLIVIETTDIIFALDSSPAIIAVSKLFHFLKYGLSTILIFIGAKILLSKVLEAHNIQIDIKTDLLVIGSILILSVIISLLFPEKMGVPKHETHEAPKHPKA